MAQYIFTMNRVGKIVPPKRQILKDISLSFFPGAKIGVLGLNGSGKSTLLRIMAGVDTDILGEARPQPGIKIGYLSQEPQLDAAKTCAAMSRRPSRSRSRTRSIASMRCMPTTPNADADFDALAKEQGELEDLIEACDGHNLDRTLEVAADALRLPPWDAAVAKLSGGERRRVALCRCCCPSPTCCCSTNPPTISTPNRSPGWNASCRNIPAPWSPSPTTATSSTMSPAGFWNWIAATAFPGKATTPPGWNRRSKRLAHGRKAGSLAAEAPSRPNWNGCAPTPKGRHAKSKARLAALRGTVLAGIPEAQRDQGNLHSARPAPRRSGDRGRNMSARLTATVC